MRGYGQGLGDAVHDFPVSLNIFGRSVSFNCHCVEATTMIAFRIPVALRLQSARGVRHRRIEAFTMTDPVEEDCNDNFSSEAFRCCRSTFRYSEGCL